jgi:hypothetical protein
VRIFDGVVAPDSNARLSRGCFRESFQGLESRSIAREARAREAST